MTAKPEVRCLPLRFLIERGRCFISRGKRNRCNFELKQPALKERVQWAIAIFVNAARQHTFPKKTITSNRPTLQLKP
jgi:hypothetical protein